MFRFQRCKMLKNKKSQIIIFRIMFCILIFIVALNFSQPTKEVIADARNSTELNCTGNPSIGVVDNATCIVLDAFIFYFISIVIALGLAFVSGKTTIEGVLTTIFTFILTITLITPLKSFIVLFRDATHLNCAATTSTGLKMACIFVDLWLFYFVIIVISTAVTLIFTTKVFPGGKT